MHGHVHVGTYLNHFAAVQLAESIPWHILHEGFHVPVLHEYLQGKS